MVLQGTPGIGKTTFAAHAPGVLFGMPQDETGLITLLDSGTLKDVPYLPLWQSWEDVLGSIKELTESDHPYKTFVIDGFSGVEALCHQHLCDLHWKGEMDEKGFLSYNKGFEMALTHWRQFLDDLDRLRMVKRMSIILLAHTKVSPFRNPDGEDYDRYAVDCHQKTWSLTNRWADIVIFATYIVQTVKEGARHKGRGGHERIMYTEFSPAYDAKNRHGLPESIDMGQSGQEAWDNFIAAMREKE